MINILHISDLHYSSDPRIHPFRISDVESSDYSRTSLAESVASCLKSSEQSLPISGIIVSGDLRWSTCKDGFKIASREIRRLSQALNVKQENIVVVPGNHDADWDKSPDARFSQYKRADAQITGKPATKDLEKLTVISNSTDALVIYGVNSAAIESKEDAGTGLVREMKLDSLFKRHLPDETRGKRVIKILCLHHHLLPVAHVCSDYFTDSRKRTSVTLDAMAILSLCALYDISLVVHGHQHQPCLAAFTCISPLDQDLNHAYSIWVSGAGSAGLDRNYLGDVGRRHLQVLQFGFQDALPRAKLYSFASDMANSFKFSPSKPVEFQLSHRVLDHPVIEFDSCRYAKTACLGINEAFPAGCLPAVPFDNSDLFILLLKCWKCKRTNQRLRGMAASLAIDGIYDLYGDYDILLKIRCNSQKIVEDSVLHPLLADGLLDASYNQPQNHFENVQILNIANELLPPEAFRRRVDIIKGIKVFIRFSDVKRRATLQAICEDAIKTVWGAGWAGKIAICGLYFSEHHAIAEIYISCGSYAALNEVTQKLEEQLETGRDTPRKITMLGQSIWESAFDRARTSRPPNQGTLGDLSTTR